MDEEQADTEEDDYMTIAGMNILLAEDNELMLEVVRDLLEERGAVITAAGNGREAVQVFSDHPEDSFGAVLMDIAMPEMNGTDAARAIRGLDRRDSASVPIIAMTADPYEENVAKTREAGMDACLPKPVDLRLLISILEDIHKNR